MSAAGQGSGRSASTGDEVSNAAWDVCCFLILAAAVVAELLLLDKLGA